VNSEEDDPGQRVIYAAEAAMSEEGWKPRRTIVIAEVIGEKGERLLLGAASEGIATWDLIGMLTQELAVVYRDIDKR